MSKYYTGRYARKYNTQWYTLIECTHAEVLAMIDIAALRNIPERLGRQPRVLDIACGTGLLLRKLLDRVPNLEIAGIDASRDMLSQARAILKDAPNVQLRQEVIGSGEVGLPYAPHTFDLITCTNALHYLPDLTKLLADLRYLLAPKGYIVLQDYILPKPPFPWIVLDRLLDSTRRQYMSEYTLAEAQQISKVEGFHIIFGKVFLIEKITTFFPVRIIWLWNGWALQLSRPDFNSVSQITFPS